MPSTEVSADNPAGSPLKTRSHHQAKRGPQTVLAMPAQTTGVIFPEVLYTLETFKFHTGLKDAALRSARNSGLVILYRHGLGFVLGSDFISYVTSHATKPGNRGGA
jgi:hypothetical protein